MNRVGVIRCLLAAILFGATAPAASQLAGTIPTFTLAGLLYLGAAAAVLPAVIKRPPTRQALAAEWRPVTVAVVAERHDRACAPRGRPCSDRRGHRVDPAEHRSSPRRSCSL